MFIRWEKINCPDNFVEAKMENGELLCRDQKSFGWISNLAPSMEFLIEHMKGYPNFQVVQTNILSIPVLSNNKQNQTPKTIHKCHCDTIELFRYGCKCGGL